METKRDRLEVRALPGYPEEIGCWLWAMEDVRSKLLNKIGDLTQAELDAQIDGYPTTIGALLYHIARVEAGWLYFDILQANGFGADIEPWLRDEERDEQGMLSHETGESLDRYMERLAVVRRDFLNRFKAIDSEDWRRIRVLPDEYDVTPEWAVYHLLEHEAHHRGQIYRMIGQLRRRT
ncbi:DinB family protein [Saccharibacillus sp. CPCC 101409]|uniref:DinB family protein n=1 Tax=Saccharibacillus sp. CPCC 101409 TaxID=3058041 RepID=UPI002673BE7E|nr:DinB family protein [Saccharibacillus sp. CPCC 101409]MDO3411816.1 DinB family protein [Saccharibacillus sp. CPCC 101409]